MVRTYWLVPVFNEASGNLDLQPDRTDDQIESNFGPVLCAGILAGPRERPPPTPGNLKAQVRARDLPIEVRQLFAGL